MKKLSDIFLRYFILILVALPNLFIFYFIFTPLTLYPVYFLLKIFYNTTISGNIISFDRYNISIVEACVAGSAYYLLLILNLSTPKIKIKQRIKAILFSFLSLLVLNILRIVILALLLSYSPGFFDVTHKVFWYFISIIFVICVWFAEVRFFNIKEIPFYSDTIFLASQISSKK